MISLNLRQLLSYMVWNQGWSRAKLEKELKKVLDDVFSQSSEVA